MLVKVVSRQINRDSSKINCQRRKLVCCFLVLTLFQGTLNVFAGVDTSSNSGTTIPNQKHNGIWVPETNPSDINETYPFIHWNRTYGGSKPDSSENIIKTSDNGFVIIGTTRSSGAGDNDGWMIKTNAHGDVEWENTYGGSKYDEANSVIETSDSGFAFVGSTWSSGAGAWDAWIVKTDSQGEVEWEKTVGGTQGDGASALIETPDGGFVFCGSTFSYGAGEADGWLVKTDAHGEVEWQQYFGGSKTDILRTFIPTTDSGFTLVGYTASYGAGGWDAWLLKTDENGVTQWSQNYGANKDDTVWSGIQIDEGFALVGFTQSYGQGSRDFWLIKTDNNGNSLWNRTYGGIDYDEAWAIIETPEEGFLIAGSSWSNGTGDGDVMLLKTDINGEIEWTKIIGGPENDEAKSLIQINNDFAITGHTYSYGSGDRDVWVVKFGSQMSTTNGVSTFSTTGEFSLGLSIISAFIIIPYLLWIKKRRFRR